MDVLKKIADDDSTKMEARQQALGLSTCVSRLETGIMVVLWDQNRQRFQMTSMLLQSSDQDLNTACSLYESLIGYVETLRNSFNEIVEKSSNLTCSDQYQDEGNSRRRRKRNQRFDDSGVEGDTLDAMNSSERFRIESYLVIIDSLVAALSSNCLDFWIWFFENFPYYCNSIIPFFFEFDAVRRIFVLENKRC